MTNQTIRVCIISLDGKIRAKEVNPIKKPQVLVYGSRGNKQSIIDAFHKENESRWKQAESKLRTFEIESISLSAKDSFVNLYPNKTICLKLGSVHSAEIISDNTIKIIS